MAVINSPDGTPISSSNPFPVSGALTLSGEVEVKNDSGTPLSVTSTDDFATETTLQATNTSLGSDGSSPPLISGSGVRGWLRAIYEKIIGTLTVDTGLSQPLTDSQLRASPVAVSGSFYQATQPISATSLPLPSGAAQEHTTSTSPNSSRLTDGTSFYDARQIRALTSSDSITVANSVTVIDGGGSISIDDNGGSITIDGSVNIGNSPTVNQGTAGAQSWPVSVSNFPATQQVSGTGTFNTQITTGIGTSEANPLAVKNVSNTNIVSVVGAAAAAVTATLPAAGAGLFHYIDTIEITMYNTAARTGVATPVTVTTTNFPTALAYTMPSAGAIGTVTTQMISTDRPIKSSTANTQTTIVCPATASVIWRVNVYYSIGA